MEQKPAIDILKLSLYELIVQQLRVDGFEEAAETVLLAFPLLDRQQFQVPVDNPNSEGQLFSMYRELLSSPLAIETSHFLTPNGKKRRGSSGSRDLSPSSSQRKQALVKLAGCFEQRRTTGGGAVLTESFTSSASPTPWIINSSGIPWTPIMTSNDDFTFQPSKRQGASATEKFSASHRKACSVVRVNNSGNLVVSGGDDLTVRVTRAEFSHDRNSDNSGSVSVRTDLVAEWNSPPTALALHPTRDMVVVGTTTGTLSMCPLTHDYSSTSSLFNVNESAAIKSLDIHSYGDHLIVSSSDPVIRMYDLRTAKCYTTVNSRQHHTDAVNDVKFSPFLNIFASASSDGSIQIWDSISNRVVNRIPVAHKGYPVSSIAFGSKENSLISSGLDGKARLWDLRSGNELQTFGSNITSGLSYAKAVLVGKNDDIVALTATSKGMTTFEDVLFFDTSGQIVGHAGCHPKPVTCLEAVGGNSMVVTSCLDGKCRALDIWQF